MSKIQKHQKQLKTQKFPKNEKTKIQNNSKIQKHQKILSNERKQNHLNKSANSEKRKVIHIKKHKEQKQNSEVRWFSSFRSILFRSVPRPWEMNKCQKTIMENGKRPTNSIFRNQLFSKPRTLKAF